MLAEAQTNEQLSAENCAALVQRQEKGKKPLQTPTCVCAQCPFQTQSIVNQMLRYWAETIQNFWIRSAKTQGWIWRSFIFLSFIGLYGRPFSTATKTLFSLY